MSGMVVGKNVSVHEEDLDGDPAAEEAGRRLARALEPGAIDALLADAQATGTPIDGVDGLLNQMTKAVLERALQGEMSHHLGYERDDPSGAGTGNSRNGHATKTVSTTSGPVTLRVPATVTANSNRRSCRNGSAGSVRSTRSCCPATRVDVDPRYRSPLGRGLRGERVSGDDLEYHRHRH